MLLARGRGALLRDDRLLRDRTKGGSLQCPVPPNPPSHRVPSSLACRAHNGHQQPLSDPQLFPSLRRATGSPCPVLPARRCSLTDPCGPRAFPPDSASGSVSAQADLAPVCLPAPVAARASGARRAVRRFPQPPVRVPNPAGARPPGASLQWPGNHRMSTSRTFTCRAIGPWQLHLWCGWPSPILDRAPAETPFLQAMPGPKCALFYFGAATSLAGGHGHLRCSLARV